MSDFKVGEMGYCLMSNTHGLELITYNLSMEKGKIVQITANEKTGLLLWLENFRFAIEAEAVYKSKQDCIDAFKKRLDEL